MITVAGKPFRPNAWRSPSIHRLRSDFPPRYVVSVGLNGWNACNLCGREHRVWMTDDRVWGRLPPAAREFQLCTRCFRSMVGEGD